MIEYIKGNISGLSPAEAVIDTPSGVGYGVQITLTDYSRLENSAANAEEVKLYIHESIREDAWTLYGFTRPEEREIFRKLIGVSGVGASTARMILSSLSACELVEAISGGDSRKLKGVKGVGAKTAERIIVDLHDKINSEGLTLDIGTSGPTASSEVFEEALAALVVLGYSALQSRKALKKIFEAHPDIKVDAAVRMAFPML